MSLIWAHPQPKMRRSCLRRMWLFEEPDLEGEQERRAAVYRQAPRADFGSAVWIRPAGLAWHAAVDRAYAGDESVPLEQPDSAEGVRLTRGRSQPATEGGIAGRGRGGGSTGALPGLV